MWMKPHQWNMVPYTKYEIRRELRVRESRHTAMVFDRKYFNIDTGKYDTDKLSTIYSQSLSDYYGNGYGCADIRHTQDVYSYEDREPIFIPKDDDFDEECRRDDEIKRKKKETEDRAQEAERQQYLREIENRQRKADEEDRIKREVERRLLENERDKVVELIRKKEKEYAKLLADAEQRAIEQQRVRMAHAPQPGKFVCNIRPNKWRAK